MGFGGDYRSASAQGPMRMGFAVSVGSRASKEPEEQKEVMRRTKN